MQVFIDTANTSITVKNKCFFIANKDLSRQISPQRISSIAISSNCTLNTAAIKLAAQHQIPILFFNTSGKIQARLWSPYFVNIAALRKKQLIFSMSEMGTDWVIEVLKKKTAEQMVNMQRLAERKQVFKEEVASAKAAIQVISEQFNAIKNCKIETVRNSLMGFEGNISRHYFQTLNLFLPKAFQFEKRSRRPALDYFNAGLNYCYGMTYSVVENGVFAKGLDPFIGLLHSDNFNRPTLIFDLIEPLRPHIDRMLIDLILSEQLSSKHFTQKKAGVWVNKPGKRLLISSFNNFLQTRISIDRSARRLKDHIFQQSNHLGQLIDESIELL